MRCQKHPTDHTSSTGVCASCLRQRLFSLIAAQTPPHAQPDIQSTTHPPPQPQPLVLPQSASTNPDPPEFRDNGGVAPAKKQQRKFSLLSHLFRSRSAKFNSDYDDASTRSAHAGSISSQAAEPVRISSSSPSWFQRGRRRGPAVSSLEDSGDSIRWEPFWVPDRGDFQEGSASTSESSSQRRRMTSASDPAPVRPTRALAHSNGMGLFTNPLVWASPSRYGKQKRGASGLSGDIGAASQPHNSTAAADAKRTRKLTELGRANKKR